MSTFTDVLDSKMKQKREECETALAEVDRLMKHSQWALGAAIAGVIASIFFWPSIIVTWGAYLFNFSYLNQKINKQFRICDGVIGFREGVIFVMDAVKADPDKEDKAT